MLFASCEKAFDYSPYIIDFDEENTNVNSKNITKIIKQDNLDGVITIAFTADSHRCYDELDKFVKSVNKDTTYICVYCGQPYSYREIFGGK